jgi:CheY-like chemotaxis protein
MNEEEEMNIQASCDTCGRRFLLAQIGPGSDAPGRCPFCGARFARHYTTVLLEAVPEAEMAVDNFVHALSKLQAMETGFDVDMTRLLEEVADQVRSNEQKPRTASSPLPVRGGSDATDQEDEGGDTINVLVVTDDALIADEVRYGFPSGVEVDVALDAGEAWQSMRDKIPSVAVLDFRSGNAGGFSLASDMTNSPRLAGVPVLMLLEREQDSWLAEQAGATLYRIKPLDTSALVRDVMDVASNPRHPAPAT